jgi:hypothetical protein
VDRRGGGPVVLDAVNSNRTLGGIDARHNQIARSYQYHSGLGIAARPELQDAVVETYLGDSAYATRQQVFFTRALLPLRQDFSRRDRRPRGHGV